MASAPFPHVVGVTLLASSSLNLNLIQEQCDSTGCSANDQNNCFRDVKYSDGAVDRKERHDAECVWE